MGNVISQTDGKGNTTKYVYDDLYRKIKQIDALGDEETYSYDAVENMTTKLDRNGNTIVFEYYDNGELKSETVESINYQYTYDSVGNLLTATDSTGTTSYTYDNVNNMLSETTSDGKSINYTYDAEGNKLTVTDITGKTTIYTYDKMNRMKTVSTSDGTNTYEYDANGNRRKLTLANGSYTTYDFDSNNQLITENNYVEMKNEDFSNIVQTTTSSAIYVVVDSNVKTTTSAAIDVTTSSAIDISIDDGNETTTSSAIVIDSDNLIPTGSKDPISINTKGHTVESNGGVDYLKSTYTYTYDANSYQTSKTEPKGTTDYEYDTLGRLIKVTEPNNRVTTYSYDLAGNRSTQTVTGDDVNSDISYDYNARNQLLQTVENRNGKAITTDYSYDSNGNQIEVSETVDGSSKISTYKYDALNQLTKATTSDNKVIENTYNFKGMRTSKTVDGVKTAFYYDEKSLVAEVTDQGAVRSINGINLLAKQGQDTLYYLYNGHSDVVAIVNGEGVITNQYDYDVFGNVILSSEAYSNSSKYSGYFYDEETGYYYLQSRYYDPKIARFITEDTYKGKYSDPLSLNLYTYVQNNPIRHWDPNGHWGIDIGKIWNSTKKAASDTWNSGTKAIGNTWNSGKKAIGNTWNSGTKAAGAAWNSTKEEASKN